MSCVGVSIVISSSTSMLTWSVDFRLFLSSLVILELIDSWSTSKPSSEVDSNDVDLDRLLEEIFPPPSGVQKTKYRRRKNVSTTHLFIWKIIEKSAFDAVEIVAEKEFFDGPFDDDIKNIVVGDVQSRTFLPGVCSDDGKEQLIHFRWYFLLWRPFFSYEHSILMLVLPIHLTSPMTNPS